MCSSSNQTSIGKWKLLKLAHLLFAQTFNTSSVIQLNQFVVMSIGCIELFAKSYQRTLSNLRNLNNPLWTLKMNEHFRIEKLKLWFSKLTSIENRADNLSRSNWLSTWICDFKPFDCFSWNLVTYLLHHILND